jgi:GTP cyclohydrolase I
MIRGNLKSPDHLFSGENMTEISEESRAYLQMLVANTLTELGLDLEDPNLIDTPRRFVKMLQEEFLVNNGKEPKGIITSFPNDDYFDEIILLDNIPFVSLCSHHFLPFPGLAWFAYIPNTKLIGASKPSRILDFFSKKPQLQEKLATEVVEYFMKEAMPQGAMLVMRAVHGCMACRGIKSGENAGMTTSITRGCFRTNPETRAEALDLIKLSVALRR